MAKRKHGSITTIITIAARLVPALFLSRKNSGKPRANAAAKENKLPFGKVERYFCFYFC